jgi:putative ABC transport system permease protein
VTPEIVRSVLNPPESDERAFSLEVESFRSYLTAGLEPLALGAFLAGLLIVLVSAANVSNLLLARGAWRARDFATRGALGASRSDLARLVLVELSMLAALGVACGLLVVQLALWAVHPAIPAEYVALGAPRLTARVVLFAMSVGAGVMLTGVVPAFAAWRLAPATLLAHASATESRGVRALRFAMAAGQSAIAMILVAGATLLGHSFVNLVSQDTGLDGDVIVVAASYPPGYRGDPLRADIDATVLRLNRTPGVSIAAAGTGPMVDGMNAGTMVRINGEFAPLEPKRVTPGYFDAVGAQLVAGRLLEPGDGGYAGVVINEQAARDFWPDGSPVGQSMMRGNTPVPIVGVVADAFDHALDVKPGRTMFSLLDAPTSGYRVNFLIRTTEPVGAISTQARRAVVEVNRDAIVTDVSTLGSRLADSVRDRTFATLVLGFFAVAGVGVCAAGLVGIVTFVVARRTREIAIRTAIGAEPRHVRRLVTRPALTAALTGIVVGVAAGRWLSAWLESLLYGVEAGDWQTLAVAAVVVLTIVVVASWLPARRALRLSPTVALRTE